MNLAPRWEQFDSIFSYKKGEKQKKQQANYLANNLPWGLTWSHLTFSSNNNWKRLREFPTYTNEGLEQVNAGELCVFVPSWIREFV